jgi:hypothetical protein
MGSILLVRACEFVFRYWLCRFNLITALDFFLSFLRVGGGRNSIQAASQPSLCHLWFILGKAGDGCFDSFCTDGGNAASVNWCMGQNFYNTRSGKQFMGPRNHTEQSLLHFTRKGLSFYA